MNTLLMKHRPKDTTPEKWKAEWESAVHLLRPLAALLQERKAGLARVNADDFDTPNHYGKLVWQGARITEIDYLLSLLPEGLDK